MNRYLACCAMILAVAAPPRSARAATAGRGGLPRCGPGLRRAGGAGARAHCLECHGATIRKGRLSLATEDAFRKGGRSGPAVDPGEPESSLLWEHVASGTMPKGRPGLSGDEKAILRKWIADGARWGTPEIDPFSVTTDRRARLRLVVAPAGPDRSLRPRSSDADWPRNDVDRFVLARLEARGLSPGAGGRPADADPPPLVRPDRPAARAGGGRALRRRPGPGRLREAGRSAARLAPSRRAPGAALAGRGPVRREPGLRVQPHPRQRLALPRLGGRTRSTATCPTTSSSGDRSPGTCSTRRTSTR